MRILRYLLSTCICVGWICGGLSAKQVNNYQWRYAVNVLANWLPEKGDDSARLQVFRSPDHRLSLEVKAWERRELASLAAMYTEHLQALHGTGVVSRYRHMGYDVLLARIDYYSDELREQSEAVLDPSQPASQGLELQGRLEMAPRQDSGQKKSEKKQKITNNAVAFVVYFYGAQYAYRVASIGMRNASMLERDIQYSVLDSFGFEGHNHWHWGPVSSFFVYQKKHQQEFAPAHASVHDIPKGLKADVAAPQSEVLFVDWRFGDYNFHALQRPQAEQVAEDVLQREKRILQATAPKLYPYALERFYYMNFRQNYSLLKDLAVFLHKKYQEQGGAVATGRAALPVYEYLLYDLQSMLLSGERSTEASPKVDLELPSRALSRGSGNIETLALINSIINSHFQHNTLIIYSPKYSQLLVGVEQLSVDEQKLAEKYSAEQNLNNFEKYNGIEISWYQNRYLIGELAARIYIGWARTPWRDLQSWIPLSFSRYIVPDFFP